MITWQIPPRGTALMGLYSTKLSDEEIREAFVFKHGYPPEKIVRTGGGALAGPITEKK